MKLAPLTAQEARLLLDHLDNVQASNLPEHLFNRYWSAKHKLIDIEVAGEIAAQAEAKAKAQAEAQAAEVVDLRKFTRAA